MICPYCGKPITYNSFFGVFYCRKCGGFFKQATVMECNDLNKPLTNAQKIRAMSDEELADFLLKMMSDVQCFAEGILPYHSCPQNHNCKQCGIDWLNQPAEEDKYD